MNLQGIFQATFTAGIYVPKPISTIRYYHRSLNPKKLIDVKFLGIPHNMTVSRFLKSFKIKDAPTLPLRPMVKEDVESVVTLLNSNLAKFTLAPHFTLEEANHWLLPKDKVIYSFVIQVSFIPKCKTFLILYVFRTQKQNKLQILFPFILYLLVSLDILNIQH